MLLRRTDLPLERDASARFLPWLVAVMVYLAALALICAMAMHKVVVRWDQGLAGRITVQVPAPAPGEDSAVQRVRDALSGAPGIIEPEILGSEEIMRLLEPWLGSEASSGSLPLPALIAARVDPAAPLDLERLGAELARIAPGTTIDDHQVWLGGLLDLARSVQLVAGLVVLLILASAVAMVIFATRMGLSVHRRIIELLHLIGAQDAYVARQFQSHALKLALRGGVLGLLVAILTVLLLGQVLVGAEAELFPDLSLLPLEWSILALVPLCVAGIALLTARLTVLRTLGRLP